MSSHDSAAVPGLEPSAPHFDTAAMRFDAGVVERLERATTSGISLVSSDIVPAYSSVKPQSYELTKRIIDFTLAFIGLIVLFPLLVVTAILIKLSDFGPILFCQTRVGRGGAEFTCYKFRTMVVNAEELKDELLELNHHQDGITFKIPRDPRATRLGLWLRKTSIDELPQLVNVLKGDMSIVGPRPPVPSEVAWYTPFDLRRLEVRPGLTCTWQVSGRGDVPFGDQVRLDVQYIENRSLWLDSKLILQTIPAVLSGRGAY